MEAPEFPPVAAENDTAMMQIIDDDYQFIESLPAAMRKWKFVDRGFDFNVVSILGSQSSGKSTLLNLLFGTTFPEMDAHIGRQQTTRGLWIAPCHEAAALVMDVEGTDSKERGELHMNFERKSALFSLALSEVLMVNMWSNDVGRYQASNYGLLKNVLDLHLQLFQEEGCRTLLLFVLRDHSKRMTTAELLTGSLRKDMENIWSDLVKPEKFKNSSVTDFFDLEFAVLPHKEYAEDEFLQCVGDLRKRFEDKSGEGIFKRDYKKNIPADGFNAYASKIWETIMSNKDVDIPTQKEMLATYRCEEISDEVYQPVGEQFAVWRAAVASGQLVPNFGKRAQELIDGALAKYDSPASRYVAQVRNKKRHMLESRMMTDASSLYQIQLDSLSTSTTAEFKRQMKAFSSLSALDAAQQFGRAVTSVRDQCLSTFAEKAAEARMPAASWSFDDAQASLSTMLNDEVAALRSTTVKLMTEGFKDVLAESLGELVAEQINRSGDGMWDVIRSALEENVQNACSTVLSKCAHGLDASDQEISDWTNAVRAAAVGCVKEKMTESIRFLPLKMVKRFESTFKFDANRIPRVWTADTDVTALFMEARKQGETLLELYSHLRLSDDFAADPAAVILAASRVADIKDQYESDIQPIFKETLEIQRRNNAEFRIPLWVYPVILFLGFNELILVLTSPLLLISCLLLGVVVAAVHISGQQNAVGFVVKTLLQQLQQLVGNMAGGANAEGGAPRRSMSSAADGKEKLH
ncbi:hypothetical protein CAOG_00337 [Capsaspora owczarzaki ATCC 30864]|uniref:hypothetical protein n=1 Tax=Capsaspora owczarzaki (strain ATCC 30864) TaxID=595528 RepID=UPI0003527099|nr:hypothetical protein CAOG_00337 [Capsaspora owczarzaki ATCC 30864]|eukprot:XP_004365208.2 hypothetical protein CAOG_00337 [Capsaspora owczarzaki ATCC 30864]